MTPFFDIVILGLSITSSWGNGHATTWRSLVRGLADRGYRILFLERDVEWYAANRDDPQPYGAKTVLYQNTEELERLFPAVIRGAPLVIVGSYVPDGIRIGEWVNSVAEGRTAFYDIDTPVTMAALESNGCEYITSALISKYDAYLSFTGGPLLRFIEEAYGSPMARPLYCSVDNNRYFPRAEPTRWDLGYLGTYSADRQPKLEALLIETAQTSAGTFVVAGSQYPAEISWPKNVDRITHLPPADHPSFYCAQRFTLNITREAMVSAGYSPSVRLFEAAACGVPIISDWWDGLDSLFTIGSEVLVAEDEDDVKRYLQDLSESRRHQISAAACAKVLQQHTSAARAAQLETYWKEMNDNAASHSSWRDGRRGQNSGGAGSRLEPQSSGQTPSEATHPSACRSTHQGYLFESAGENA